MKVEFKSEALLGVELFHYSVILKILRRDTKNMIRPVMVFRTSVRSVSAIRCVLNAVVLVNKRSSRISGTPKAAQRCCLW